MMLKTKKGIFLTFFVGTLTLSLFLCFTLLFNNNNDKNWRKLKTLNGRVNKGYEKLLVDNFGDDNKKLSIFANNLDLIDQSGTRLTKWRQSSIDCIRPKHPSNRLTKMLKKVQSSSCRKSILNEACLLEENRLYPDTIQTQCNESSAINRGSKSFNKRTASIAFLILIRGRQIRQIKRLFINLYRSDFSYFFYIDSCSNYTFVQLNNEFNGLFENVFIKRYSPLSSNNCGLANDFDLTLSALKEFLIRPNYWKFDYLIKLNENDFPILPMEELARFFAITYGSNYIEFQNVSSLTAKAKLYSTCIEDDYRYYIGNGQPPRGIVIQSGPFSFALTKEFVKYFLTETSEVSGALFSDIRQWSHYQQNPSEILLHTYITNSIYCKTLENYPNMFVRKFIDDDRRVTTTHFRGNDFFRISPDNNMEKLQFFAVGFDPTENQQIIDNIESVLNIIPADTNMNTKRRIEYGSGYKSFWLNVWTSGEEQTTPKKDDGADESFRMIARAIISSRLKRCTNIQSKLSIKPTSLTTLRRFDTFEGVLIGFTVECGRSGRLAELEAFIRRSYVKRLWSYDENYKDLLNDETNSRKELLNLRVVMADGPRSGQPSFFRKDVDVFGSNDKLKLITDWVLGDDDIDISIVWMNPYGYVKALQNVNVTQSATTAEMEPKFHDPLEAGLWKVQIVNNLKIIGETEFLVFPNRFDDNQAKETSSSLNSAVNLLNFKKLFTKFYTTKRICIRKRSRSIFATCRCAKPDLPECENTNWSSYSVDRKSDIRQLLVR